jgi:transcriptional regulator with XRE-family HTH domain
MPFSERLTTLRKERNLTQQTLGDKIKLTKAQVYRYEKGTSKPTLDVIKKLAIVLNVSTDQLIFGEDERNLPNALQLKFEAVSQMSEEDQHTVQSLIDGMILKHTANQLAISNKGL